MRAHLFLISLALSSAACSDPQEYAEKTGVERTAEPVAEAKPAKVAAREIKEETERYMFDYSWPAEVAAEPGLVAVLEKDAESMRSGLAAEADEDWDGAEGQDWEPRQHRAAEEWKVVADLPRFLSLSGHLATYSGGAHGMYGVESLVWDREQGKATKAVELFASATALERALGAKLCTTLNAAREKRRGMAIDPESSDTFDACPGLDEATILLGSSNGKTFDRLAVYFGPYVAGAYAEGDYELDFPVTAAVIDAVKPEYADAFTVKR
ncbi:DUF4163 domain-containing protein [Qipengyuania sp. 6B39]|uniref:DUF4163 domain-containing protein n=1 Tax=Qipengyuania proteolytica TaxID=2867239 RepID=UPI001C8975DA|nr:DUF4163 domain-containing protein [Qipengyuania proteolytica]MBX7496654.1 DUF4163 domain-containing protein [Qipengyuania proteolytica]